MSKLKNYLKKSEQTGWYSYRRRIPAKLKDSFLNSDGKPRGNEWKQALKTKSISIALKRAVEINDRFEQTKVKAKARLKASEIPIVDLNKQQRLIRSAEFFRREGVHPDQAPTVNAPEEVQKAWIRKRDKILDEISDIQHDVGLDHEIWGWADHEQKYTPNDLYYEMQAEMDFLKGDTTAIKSKLRVTWDVAVDEYLNHKARLSGDPKTFLKGRDATRIRRIAKSFATSIGTGDTYLADISRQEARLWIEAEEARRVKNGNSIATVARETSTLSAIFSRAITEYSTTDAQLQSNGNPFSRLRGELEKIDAEHVRTGKRVAITSRAWTPDELASMEARLSMMNDEAQLCTKLVMFTGARLKDVTGLMIDDLFLDTDENSYINFRHNTFRRISKDSIERIFPLYGDMLKDLKDYISQKDFSSNKKLTPRYAKDKESANHLSALLNKKHIDKFSKDPSLIMHGMRDTLQAKFDAAQFMNKVSGYLIGWKNQETIGMQSNYNRQGYPHKDMLETVRKAHSITEWATQKE